MSPTMASIWSSARERLRRVRSRAFDVPDAVGMGGFGVGTMDSIVSVALDPDLKFAMVYAALGAVVDGQMYPPGVLAR